MIDEDDPAVATVVLPVSVRDLLPRDLPACTWSGSATHLLQVERELARAAAGEVDYLAVCTPVDLPVAIGGIDYQVSAGAGTLWQLAVLPALQSRGLGTLLIRFGHAPGDTCAKCSKCRSARSAEAPEVLVVRLLEGSSVAADRAGETVGFERLVSRAA